MTQGVHFLPKRTSYLQEQRIRGKGTFRPLSLFRWRLRGFADATSGYRTPGLDLQAQVVQLFGLDPTQDARRHIVVVQSVDAA